MPYDLMKTSFFSEERCEGSNPDAAATNHLWLDRSAAKPLHRTCKSFPVSCSVLLLATALLCLVLCTALCVLEGNPCFPVLASSAHAQYRESVGLELFKARSPPQPDTSDTSILWFTPSPSISTVAQAHFVEAALLNQSIWGLWLLPCLLRRHSCCSWDCGAVAQERKLLHVSFGVSFIYLFCVDPVCASVILLG